MADDTEQFIPHEHAIAAWAQKIRYSEALAYQWLRFFEIGLIGVSTNLKGHGLASTVAFTQRQMGNFSEACQAQFAEESIPSSALQLMIAKCVYWMLVPLFQYICAMILADTFQYFTHRAFHVNKWLYSELKANCTIHEDVDQHR